MRRIRSSHTFIAYTAGIMLLCVVAASVLTWRYRDIWHKKALPEIAYAHFGPLVVKAHGYAYRASISLQGSAEDTRWMMRNNRVLEKVLYETLANAEPVRMRSPSGLDVIQKSLKVNLNATLDAPRVQQVWITDFVWESEDY